MSIISSVKQICKIIRIWMKHKYQTIKYHHKLIYLFLTPEHQNIGDAAIAVAEHCFLEDYFGDYHVEEITDTYVRNHSHRLKKALYSIICKDIILVQGGGFLGSIWYEESECYVRELLENNMKSSITVLPQTVYYENSDDGKIKMEESEKIYNAVYDLTMCTREKFSFKLAHSIYKAVYLIPDIVLYMDAQRFHLDERVDREGAILCFRKDIEKTISDTEVEKAGNILKEMLVGTMKRVDMEYTENIIESQRIEVVKKQLKLFRNTQLVVTDRLHGMIFAAIAETPCIVLKSKSHKVLGCYEWIKHLGYIRFVKSVDEIEETYRTLPDPSECHYDMSELTLYYEKLSYIIRRAYASDN